MDEPFREGMGAALARIGQLAEENEELHQEVERLRTHAQRVKTNPADEHAGALADQTLRVLEQLEVLSQRRPRVAAPEATPSPAADEGRAEDAVLVSAVRDATTAPLVRTNRMDAAAEEVALRETAPLGQPIARASAAPWVAACFVCFALGFLACFALLVR